MSRRGAVFYALALMALVANVIVPRGYMVARGADGLPQIALCTGYGPAAAVAEEFRKRLPDHQDDSPRDHPGVACPYAGHAAPLTAPVAGPLPVPAWSFALPPGVRPVRGIEPGRGMAAPPPPSQAPPLTSI